MAMLNNQRVALIFWEVINTQTIMRIRRPPHDADVQISWSFNQNSAQGNQQIPKSQDISSYMSPDQIGRLRDRFWRSSDVGLGTVNVGTCHWPVSQASKRAHYGHALG